MIFVESGRARLPQKSKNLSISYTKKKVVRAQFAHEKRKKTRNCPPAHRRPPAPTKAELGTEKDTRPLYMSVNDIRMEPASGDVLHALPYPEEKEFEAFSIPIVK